MIGVSSFAFRTSLYRVEKASNASSSARAWSEEARRPLREPLEAVGVEARRARVSEVVREHELGQRVPEEAVRVAVGLDHDVRVPDVLALSEALGDEGERTRLEPHPAVE